MDLSRALPWPYLEALTWEGLGKVASNGEKTFAALKEQLENPISSAFPIRDAIIRCIDRRKRAYAQVRAWAADEARRAQQQSQSPGRKDDQSEKEQVSAGG